MRPQSYHGGGFICPRGFCKIHMMLPLSKHKSFCFSYIACTCSTLISAPKISDAARMLQAMNLISTLQWLKWTRSLISSNIETCFCGENLGFRPWLVFIFTDKSWAEPLCCERLLENTWKCSSKRYRRITYRYDPLQQKYDRCS